MPKNKVSDPITDQESAFARLVLSGAMTDRQAAEAAGLKPDSAAYVKAKPQVRAYMLEHRAAVQQQLVQQDAGPSRRAVEGLHRLNLDREQVLNRLWELANLSSEMTRGSITGQVKAVSMIVAILNLVPGRHAISPENKSPAAPTPQLHTAAWLRRHKAPTTDPQPSPTPPVPASRGACPGAQQKDSPAGPEPANGPAGQAPPKPNPSQSTAEGATPPYPPLYNSVPDLGIPLPIKNPFLYSR
jgi:hypothetical protein